MIRINLLPQEERVQQRKMPALPIPRLGTVLPFVLLGGLVLAVTTVATMQGRQVAQLSHDIAQARRESESYKPQLEKIRQIQQAREEVRSRLDIIARLDRERYFRVQLLDDLSRAVPENTWLTGLNELSDRRYQIDGVTFSNFIVARFMENLETAERWRDVDLNVAQKGEMEDVEVVKFTLFSNAQP